MMFEDLKRRERERVGDIEITRWYVVSKFFERSRGGGKL